MDKITEEFFAKVKQSKSPEETVHAVSKFIQDTAQRISFQNPITDTTASLYAAAYYVLYLSVYRTLGDMDKKLCDGIIQGSNISTTCIRLGKPFDREVKPDAEK